MHALKLLSFFWSGLFAGVAGSLSALHLQIVSVNVFHWSTSGEVVMMTLLGGARTFFGPFVGATLFLFLQEEFSRFTEYWSFIIGAVLILCVRFFPEGVSGFLLKQLGRLPNPPKAKDRLPPRQSQARFSNSLEWVSLPEALRNDLPDRTSHPRINTRVLWFRGGEPGRFRGAEG